MELIPLNCNNCGSKLKVSEETRFVTCKHCDAQLAVRHEDGAAFTDVLEAAARVEKSAAAIEEHVEKLGADNERLFLQGELERLDREWESRREPLLFRNKDGSARVPVRTSSAVIGVLAVLVLAPAAMIAALDVRLQLGWAIWLFCLAMSGAVVWGFGNLNRKADLYERALAEHEADREQLLTRLRAEGDAVDAPAPRKRKKEKRLGSIDDER